MAEAMKERPAYVRFEKRALEDRTKSLDGGAYASKDVVFAIITPPGGKLVVERRVDSTKAPDGRIVEEGWLDYLVREVREDRFPEAWLDMYQRAYKRYLEGEETPLNGTPIKDWPPLSPAQRANLIAMNILTVEDLAALNAEGQARFGMGVIELQRKAKNWIEASRDIGAVTARLTALETDYKAVMEQNERQRGLIEQLQTKVKALERVPA